MSRAVFYAKVSVYRKVFLPLPEEAELKLLFWLKCDLESFTFCDPVTIDTDGYLIVMELFKAVFGSSLIEFPLFEVEKKEALVLKI